MNNPLKMVADSISKAVNNAVTTDIQVIAGYEEPGKLTLGIVIEIQLPENFEHLPAEPGKDTNNVR